MIEFEKPIITKIDENKDYGKFVIEPLERGYCKFSKCHRGPTIIAECRFLPANSLQ